MIREFFKELNLKREKTINLEEREDENPEIIKLKEIIDNKLKSEEAPAIIFEKPHPPSQLGLEETKENKRKRKEISDNEESVQKINEKIKLIELFAEQILQEHQIGIVPDDKYLEDIADMAIDYYQPHHHETVHSSHEHLTNVERGSWEEKKNERIKEAVNQLKERLEEK